MPRLRILVLFIAIAFPAFPSQDTTSRVPMPLVRAHPIETKASTSYASLSEPERVWYTVTRYILCVRDGGLISYYYNGYAQHVDDLVASLGLIHARAAREQVLNVNKLFGKEMPKSLKALNDAINSWPDSTEVDAIVNGNNEAEQLAATEAEKLLRRFAAQHGIDP